MKVSVAEAGGVTYVTDRPDYEMGTYLGSNLGLCGIQTGNVMGFAVELFERGILTPTTWATS